KNNTDFIDGSYKRSNTDDVLGRQWDRAKHLWEELKKTYDKVDGSIIFGLHHQIYTLKQNGSSITDYYHKLNALWKQFDAMIELPKCICNASEGFEKHNQLMKLMQFLMGLDDSYMQIRSCILSKEVLPDVRSAYATISSKESHRVASIRFSGSSQRSQAFAFVSNVPNRIHFQRNNQNFNTRPMPNNMNNNRQSGGSGLVCENCGFHGHTINRYLKIIGYPSDFGKKKFSSQNQKNKGVSNNNYVGTSSSSGFSDEEMATLLSLIKDNRIGKNLVNYGKIVDLGANQHMTYTDKDLNNVLDISHLKIKVGHPNGTEAFISKIGNLRMCHPAEPLMNVLKKSLKFDKPDKDLCWEVCQRAKHTREPFPLSDHISSSLGELVHLDLWRPYRVTSSEGFRNFLTVVDDDTRAVSDSDKVKDVVEKVFQDVNHINFFNLEYPKTPNDDERVDPKLNCDNKKSQSASSGSSESGGISVAADFLVNSRNNADSCDNNFATQDEGVTTLKENVFSKGNMDQNLNSISEDNQNLRRSSKQSVFPKNYNDFVVDSKVKNGIEKYVGNGTWDIVELPKDSKAIGSKWICKIKYQSSGEIDRFKARLVAQSFSQKEVNGYLGGVVDMIAKKFKLEAIDQDHDEGLFDPFFLVGKLCEETSGEIIPGRDGSRGTIKVNGIYNLEKVLKMLDWVFGHKSMECASILHQPNGVGSQEGHLGSFRKLNGVTVAIVAREIPNFDKPEPQPQPLPNYPPLDVSLGSKKGLKPPIKPHNLDSSRMKEVDHLTNHKPPSPRIASFHPKDTYCYYHPCLGDPKKHYGFKPGLLGQSGSIGVDMEMIENDWEIESKEVSFLGREINSPVRPK
nr:ribonuclease H-like domain-containing protein [Tanacetum cinerariifolium]